jgi:hypothetical protein
MKASLSTRMDFNIAHEQGLNVQLLAQAVHGHEVEMEIEFGEG